MGYADPAYWDALYQGESEDALFEWYLNAAQLAPVAGGSSLQAPPPPPGGKSSIRRQSTQEGDVTTTTITTTITDAKGNETVHTQTVVEQAK